MEFNSDVAHGLSGSNHAKDLVFAIGEKLVRGLLRVGFEIHNEFLCQGRADILAAANHFSDRLDEFCRRALFGKVPGCAGAHPGSLPRYHSMTPSQRRLLRLLVPVLLCAPGAASAATGGIGSDQSLNLAWVLITGFLVMFMQVGFAIGRIIVGLFYLFTGVNGFLNLSMTSGYAASKGVPAPMLAVIVSHLLLLVAAAFTMPPGSAFAKCTRSFRVWRNAGINSQEACPAASSKCARWLAA